MNLTELQRQVLIALPKAVLGELSVVAQIVNRQPIEVSTALVKLEEMGLVGRNPPKARFDTYHWFVTHKGKDAFQ